ncbi:MAG TPA: hypothetical protein PLW75_14355 [Hyphomicrobium sp.]|nr:hypothetical protein [Hyphomicrobium sp.]
MPSLRLAGARCAAVLFAAAAAAPHAAAQANCEMYGKLAIQQQQENEERACGFSGDAWSTDLKRHVDWCGGVAPDRWRMELQKRQQALDDCGAEAADAAGAR